MRWESSLAWKAGDGCISVATVQGYMNIWVTELMIDSYVLRDMAMQDWGK